MELPEILRTFVALDLPETTKQKLFDIQQELRSRCPSGAMSWPPLQTFHLTLFYLGNTPVSLRASIEDALATVGKKSSPFSLPIGYLGSFLKGTYPGPFLSRQTIRADIYKPCIRQLKIVWLHLMIKTIILFIARISPFAKPNEARLPIRSSCWVRSLEISTYPSWKPCA